MTPPPSYRTLPLLSYHALPPPSYHTMPPAAIAIRNNQARAPAWIRALVAVGIIILYTANIFFAAWRFYLFFNYARDHKSLMTEMPDMVALAMLVLIVVGTVSCAVVVKQTLRVFTILMGGAEQGWVDDEESDDESQV